MAALENHAGADREILFALIAAVKAFLPRRDLVAHATNWATRSLRPKATFQVDARGILIGKHLKELECRNGGIAHDFYLAFWSQTYPKMRGSQVYNPQN